MEFATEHCPTTPASRDSTRSRKPRYTVVLVDPPPYAGRVAKRASVPGDFHNFGRCSRGKSLSPLGSPEPDSERGSAANASLPNTADTIVFPSLSGLEEKINNGIGSVVGALVGK